MHTHTHTHTKSHGVRSSFARSSVMVSISETNNVNGKMQKKLLDVGMKIQKRR